jgi:serine beta-lactamase-like protein LACTB
MDNDSQIAKDLQKKGRIPVWLAAIAFVISLPFAIAAGLWEYMSATAPTLHEDPKRIPSSTRSTPSPEWAEAVDQARQEVRTALAAGNIPGVSVAVGRGDELVWAEGFGWANLESQARVTPDTKFRIGTASIALTSAAVGLLLEKGVLKLDEKIQTWVPEYPAREWPVTLGQLMAHTSGLRNDGGDEGPLFGQHCQRPVEAVPAFAGGDLRFEPGTQYRYSSFGWILVSAAVEAAAKEPFLSFMKKQVFEPLGMKATEADTSTIESEEAPIPDQATSYFPRFAADNKYGPDIMRPLDYSCYAGASAFLSTPSDLVRFGIGINRGRLLQPKTRELLQAAQRLPSEKDTGYGLGWDLERVRLSGKPVTTVGHDGDLLGGTAVSFMTFPESGIVVAVTSNVSYADTPGLALKIAEAFVTGPRSEPRSTSAPPSE